MAVFVDGEQASVVAFLHRAFPEHRLYYASIPDGFDRPSIFLPAADIESYTDTLGSFRIVRTLYVHFFGQSIPDAQGAAMQAVYTIARSQFQIPIMNADGTAEGHYLDIRPPTSRKLEDPDGASLVTLTWDSREQYPADDVGYFMQFDIEPYLKPAQAHSALGPFHFGKKGESADGEESIGCGCGCGDTDG